MGGRVGGGELADGDLRGAPTARAVLAPSLPGGVRGAELDLDHGGVGERYLVGVDDLAHDVSHDLLPGRRDVASPSRLDLAHEDVGVGAAGPVEGDPARRGLGPGGGLPESAAVREVLGHEHLRLGLVEAHGPERLLHGVAGEVGIGDGDLQEVAHEPGLPGGSILLASAGGGERGTQCDDALERAVGPRRGEPGVFLGRGRRAPIQGLLGGGRRGGRLGFCDGFGRHRGGRPGAFRRVGLGLLRVLRGEGLGRREQGEQEVVSFLWVGARRRGRGFSF